MQDYGDNHRQANQQRLARGHTDLIAQGMGRCLPTVNSLPLCVVVSYYDTHLSLSLGLPVTIEHGFRLDNYTWKEGRK